ncbi:MAG: ABC transporter substrate-binding protein [Cyanobacteria bacterium]|jgi:neutral amino acid transport system substrate-binding protein|nr:ABC transporter substrate-binding protein [Cyanobacteria bacterium GSL.Bin1]
MKTTSRKPLTLSLAVLMLSTGLLTTACQQNQTTDNNTTEDSPAEGGDAAAGLKLGGLFPTTGDLSSIGQNMPKAANLAVDTINACGGVNEQPVELIQEDTQTDPNAGSAAMSKLAEVDQVAGVIGAFASSVSGATIDIAVRNEVMQISPGSTSPVFTERATAGDFNGYWARTAPPDTYQAQALAQLASDRGFERVSTVVINNDYGVGFEQEFVKSFKEMGGTVVNEDDPVRYDPKATTFDSEAAAAFGNDPDAVLGVLYAETGSLLMRAAYQQGLSEGVTELLTDGVYSPEFVDDVGQTPEGQSIISGALGTVPGASGTALDNFREKWEADVGGEITAFVPHTWDATVLMMLAAELADENTGTAIKENLRAVANSPGTEVSDPCEAMELIRNGEEINYQGASGDIQFDENGDTVGSYDVWTVQEEGALEVIDQVTPATEN